MAEEPNKATDTKAKAGPDKTGNSRMTQALGATFTVALVAFGAITAVLGTALYFGQNRWPGLQNKVQWAHKTAIPWMGAQLSKIAPERMKNFFANSSHAKKEISFGAAMGMAGGVAILASKFIALPWFRRGWRKADAEKTELRTLRSTAQLQQEEIAELNSRLAEIPPVSYRNRDKKVPADLAGSSQLGM